jgi:predicted CXXCH cytochrome family protein
LSLYPVSRRNVTLALAGLVPVFLGGAWLIETTLKPTLFRRPAAGVPDGSGYVNSAVCAGCHQEIARTYRLTGMGRSFSRPGADKMVEDFKFHNTLYNQPSDRYYKMTERDGSWYEQRHQVGFDGKETNAVEKRIDYVIGSGNHARTYLFRNTRGNLVEMPVSWYSENGGYWAMSPGYDRANQEDFRGIIASECFSCHNAYPQSAQPEAHRSASNFENPAFSEHLPEGIDCQRCHGPGRAHIQAVAAKASPEVIRSKIVNPARLTRELQLDTCMQCHLETTSRMSNKLPVYDRAPFTYQPGEPLGDFFTYVDHAPGAGHDGKFEIAHAAYRLRMSACFRNTQITCTTCHNPHQIPRGEEAAAHYTAVCRSCHASTHSGETPAKTDCTGCHMPKRRPDDVVHVIMTDHYIQRYKPSGDLLAPLREADVVSLDAYRGEVIQYYPQGNAGQRDRRLYLDAAQVQDSTDLAPGIARFRADLDQNALDKSAPSRPEFYYELAEAYANSSNYADAIHYYDEALRRDPQFHPAASGLGVALMRAGNLDRAAEVLEKASLEKAPAESAESTALLTNLGQVYLEQHRPQAAQRVLTQSLAIEADNAPAQNLLGLTMLGMQDWTGAERAFRAALAIQPDLAEARQNLANLLAKRGGYAEARYHFERALEANPNNAETRDRYGLLLAVTGFYEKSLAQLNQAIRLNPNLAQAHADLADVLLARGEAGSAEGEYRRTLELNPEAFSAHLSLGQILARAGKNAEAREHLERAAQSPDPEIRQAAQEALR